MYARSELCECVEMQQQLIGTAEVFFFFMSHSFATCHVLGDSILVHSPHDVLNNAELSYLWKNK